MTQPTPNNPTRRGSRLAILILSLAAFVGANWLYHIVATWQPVQSGEPGELLYAAGFDGFTDEWQLFEGRRSAQITDGVMRMALDTPDTIYTAADPIYADFDMRVTTRATAGELANDGYGVIFRLEEPNHNTDCGRQWVIVCTLEYIPFLQTTINLIAPAPQTGASGYYLFLISNDGYYQILRRNAETELVEEVTIWHDSRGLLNTGIDEENRIRVVGQGDQFRFFLNDQPALLCVPREGELPTGNSDNCLGEETFIWQDDTYSRGKLGLVLTGSNDVVVFDNLTVTMPDEIITEGNNA
ncbi:MAG: hypothetical protein ACFE0Q_18320 [Anaerolineae bacterium]